MNGRGGEIRPLAPGLHFVATPIGNARDITLRGLDILASADVLLAEDTRTTRRLMELHGIGLRGRPLWAYHDHNGSRVRPRVLDMLQQGKAVAYVSDAGTPLVADPGYSLGRAVRAAGFAVLAAPGPSAALAALVVSGLASDRFLFAGFLPSATVARRKVLRELGGVPATVIFFETAKRIHRSLDVLVQEWGPERQGAICRELTKKFEEVLHGSLDELRQALADRTLKGEIVLVIDRARDTGPEQATKENEMENALDEALARMSLKDAVAQVAADLGLPRRQVYQAALRKEAEK